MTRTQNLAGSIWHRWEPHIHGPGTILNDQFGSASLEEYCQTVSECVPAIRAVGVTDYLSLRVYEELLLKKRAGKLPGVDLLFPNVEARLDIGTIKGKAVNIHLLFCPDDPNHVAEIKRFLTSLKFRFKEEDYCCSESDLVRLGRAADDTAKTEERAFAIGVNQFKLSIAGLQDELKKNGWAQKNLLIGVAASSNDGTAGVSTPGNAFDALRTSIESASQIIFSGNPKDSIFWTGRGTLSKTQITAKYRSLKPCLHGSDAHSMEKVGKPDEDRYCWIKGDVTFETLRQACIEPRERVAIGATVPRGGLVGQTISSLRVTNANWMIPCELHLNPGLVAIVGARGSGKTALADFLAVGSYSMSPHVNERSFTYRARHFLQESAVTVKWESEEETSGSLATFESDEHWQNGRVQYLSQQFVDELCSSEGMTDRLLDEIKRVIFVSHEEADREGAGNFQELYDIRCNPILEQRARHEAEIERLTDQFLHQFKLKQSIPDLRKKIEETEKSIIQDTKDRERLVSKDQEIRVKRHQEVQEAIAGRKALWETEQKQIRALKGLQGDVGEYRTRTAAAFVDDLKSLRADSKLSPEDWNLFIPIISPEVDNLLATRIDLAQSNASTILGSAVENPFEESVNVELFPADAELNLLTVNLLQAEGDRLSRLIGVDRQNTQRFAALTTKIQQSQRQLESLKLQLSNCTKAEEELKTVGNKRREAYRLVFESFADLEVELRKLYSRLGATLQSEVGALGKLKFIVRRKVNLKEWVDAGELLLDLRRDGPFKGRGSLLLAAQRELLPAWTDGSPAVVEMAMVAFLNKYISEMRAHQFESMPPEVWRARIWEWLLSTKHILVTYGLQYGEVDIESLSPGTRGIVLLLLYLAIDKEDVRPLIIDQPEENLDPQSVYDELVQRFREARQRRQIIIVTHNANLVVNTDADQVIVASAGEHAPGHLPEIKYEAGGLENDHIRRQVCEILEGGEEAFRARATRLRLSI